MFASRNQLLERVRLGEDNFLELREVRFAGDKIRGPRQDDLADEFAAFANSRGGELLLGVHDETREVSGIPIEQLDAVEALVKQACEDSLKPPDFPIIERMTLPDSAGDEKAVLRVEIPRSLNVHQSPGGYFHRVGSSKRQIPPDYLGTLFQQRSQSRPIRFDETPVSSATINELDETLWNRFATPLAGDSNEQLLSKLGMAAQDHEGIWRPTVAGVLLACRQPEKLLHNAFIQAVAYRGTEISPQSEKPYQRDARDITGPLDHQIFEACDFVRKNMWVAARKRPQGGRVDMPQFDMLVIFEAITNAVAHRDYSMYGSKVRLRLFEDRLEIYIPGSLVNTMTLESLPYRQAARNAAITSQLARCPIEKEDFIGHRTHIMDKRGEGVPFILSASEQLSGKLPEYRLIDNSELLLTIHAAGPEPR
ncbi:MAG: putative DNA binding domain-containing protein [Gammaproteobacteria bacterium]|nr:putative DNA binding domain-containing protein [Gammaproteobacteria bacterium]